MKNRFKNIIVSKILAFTLILTIVLNLTGTYSYALNINADAAVSLKEKNEPKDDFYLYVNKDWMLKNNLEGGCVCYSTFEELNNIVGQKIYKTILDIQYHKEKYDKNSNEIKILNLYENYLNLNARNKDKSRPIRKYMQEIENVRSTDDLTRLFGINEFTYFQPLINLCVGPDYKDSTKNILYISRSNLGLGNSAYYKDKGKDYEGIIKSYMNYIKKLYELYGVSEKEAEENAMNFYNFEKKLSQRIPSTNEAEKESDKLEKSYNVYKISELDKSFDNIKFKRMFKDLGIENAEKIVVEDPEQLKFVNSIIDKNNIKELKNFMSTIVLINSANFLTEDFRNASNDLKKVLYGVGKADIDNNYGVKFVMSQLEEPISKIYVEKYFDEDSKKEIMKMSKEIIDNFKERIKNLNWMSKKTRSEALKKLENINIKIGYPDTWNDYSDLNIESYNENSSLLENTIKIYLYESNKQFSKLNKQVNKSEWSMGACSVNAYYNPTNNEIVFPAGILQTPFYDKNYCKEKNLGGIGSVIGHELTHAFDNTGAKFDETGKLKDWWTKEDYKEFTTRSRKIEKYYSKIEVSKGKFVNGKLTVSENISDLGGIACVLDVANKIENPKLNELFENYANIWKEVSTSEMKEYLLNNDSHSPKKVRVNIVLSQFEDFYKIYNIKDGDKMYVKPEERVGIW